ncbi:DUF4267 domain-containing protein [Actinophytocola gossypii]|uniref:DUF4267 domain-containing protein n=1 Tax=Actinophytocola gossypii TaxID=2812003 RepID=A0ABT2JB04_9PSEU|nr:DUF4267 domain-containing protein [Actinophytocola gossypii]MCT2585047.1 DUF4267 domain-containing protein [Actinophytocola gossypii]
MLSYVANVLAGLIGAGVVLMGAGNLLVPRAALGFGIPGTPTEDHTVRAWLAVKAARDTALGALLLIVLVGATPHLLGWVMLAATAIPAADALIVARSNGPRSAVYGVHGATAAVMLATSVLLLVA